MTLFDDVVGFFAKQGWSFVQLEGRSVLQMKVVDGDEEWLSYAETREDRQQFIFYSVCPVTPPIETRPAMAEYVTRANFGLAIGNFEMDYADGELRFKTSIEVDGQSLTPALLRPLVEHNVRAVRQYLPGMVALIGGESTPAEAVARVEDRTG